MNDFSTLILSLMDKKREDTFWDFKRQWHQNNAELLHDIICLSNAEHHGERFLIIGITDPPDCKMVDVQADPNRKTQTDLIDFLSKVGFAADVRPSVSIRTIAIKESNVDVVIIQNGNQKPYFLAKYFHDGKTHLSPGAIHTRIHDKNTAIDATADLYFVERMWRERFGLDLSPLDRVQKYLLDYETWKWDGIGTGYYIIFPEFTVVVGNEEKITQSHHWWNDWPLNELSRRISYLLKFHATTLATVQVVQFDRESFAIPLPDVDYILLDNTNERGPENTYCFYSFLETSLSFALLVHLFAPHLKGKDPLRRMRAKEAFGAPSKPRLGYLPFPVFASESEKSGFIQYLTEHMANFLKVNLTYPTKELGAPKMAEEKTFAYWAYDLFWKWKEQ